MCGIAGQVGRDPRTIQRRYAAYCAMQQTLARRGPDQRGMYICGAAALIHARLAVVDLENGLQPMQLDWQGETYVLVYNGELYNTPELRAALAARGHSFNGHSDTEVLLHAFAEWGANCVPKCNGIFAFAVWQQNAGTLFLARDRCGVMHTPVGKIYAYSMAQFDHWTREPFSANFRRMLTLEQYRDPKLAQLHRDYLAGGPLEYMAAIFRRLTDTDEEAMQLALDFYGPMYLLYSVYDAAEEKETVAPMLAAHIRRFISRIETGYRWNGETDFEGGERLL